MKAHKEDDEEIAVWQEKWHRNMLQWLTYEDEYVSFLLKVPTTKI